MTGASITIGMSQVKYLLGEYITTVTSSESSLWLKNKAGDIVCCTATGQLRDTRVMLPVLGGCTHKLYLLLAGLKTPRYDRLQDTMQSLVDNLSLFNYRELLVRAVHRPIAGSSVSLL